MTDEEMIARLRMIHEHKFGNLVAERMHALLREREVAEAKLAKAVDALRVIAYPTEADRPAYNGKQVSHIARATLAEMEKPND